MRVATFNTQQTLTAEIMSSEAQLNQTRERVSSGRRIENPSDAPDQIAELLQTNSSIAQLTDLKNGADSELSYMKASDSSLNDMGSSLREIQTLALQANNATLSADQRQVIADQIDRLRSHVLDLANTQVDGRYLFAGTDTNSPPFNAGPPVTYSGNVTPVQMSVAGGTSFATSVTGDAIMNQRAGTDLFQNLSRLETAVRSGDTTAVGAGQSALDADASNISRLDGDLGARIQYVTRLQQQWGDNLTAAQGRQSDLQNVDLAQAITDEKSAELANQATLSMAAQIGQPSLLDYLR